LAIFLVHLNFIRGATHSFINFIQIKVIKVIATPTI